MGRCKCYGLAESQYKILGILEVTGKPSESFRAGYVLVIHAFTGMLIL